MHKAVKSSKSAFVFFGKSAFVFLLIPVLLLLISSCDGDGEKGNEPKSEDEVIAE